MMSRESFNAIFNSVNRFLTNFQEMGDEHKLAFKECEVDLLLVPYDRSYCLTVYGTTDSGETATMNYPMGGHLLGSFLHVTTREERVEIAAEVQRVLRRICEEIDESAIVYDSRYIDAPDPSFQEVKLEGNDDSTPKEIEEPVEPEEVEEPEEDLDYSVGLNFDLLS